jgi:exopolysaccharide production protein ExoQ
MRHDRQHVLPIERFGVEEALCVALLSFFAMQGAIPGIAPNQASEMTNLAATGLMKIVGVGSQVLVDGMIAILAIFHWRRLRRFAFSLQWSAAVALFVLLSTFWSQNAMITARRSLPFALATVLGLYFASRFSVQKQVSIVCTTMFLAALASVALVFCAPNIGLEASTGHFGNWQGIFTQKNACGRAMVFATAALLAKGRFNLSRLLCLILFVTVLVMSGSRGAWAIEGVLIVCCVIHRGISRFSGSSRTALLSAAAVLTALAIAAVWIYFPVLALLVGRDATLSGRTEIWQQVWAAIVKHPLMGYGFAAFWQGMKGESYHVILALRFVIFHAHNGVLEIWLELGAVGVLLFLFSYLRAWRKLWHLLRSPQVPQTSWMWFVLILIAFYDLEENSLLTFNGLFWILYVSTLANIEIMTVEHKHLTHARVQLARSQGQITDACLVG